MRSTPSFSKAATNKSEPFIILDLLGSVNIVCIIILNKWLGKLRGRRSSPKIKGDVLSAGDDLVAGPLKMASQIDLAKVAQHHAAAQKERRRVRFALPGNVGGGAMARSRKSPRSRQYPPSAPAPGRQLGRHRDR